VIEVDQAGGSGANARQRVGLGDLELASERLAVGQRPHALARGLLAVAQRGVAILGGLRAMRGGFDAMARGALALIGGAQHDVGVRDRARVLGLVELIALCHRQIARRRSLIARERGEIARKRPRVALIGGLQPCHGGHVALSRRALAQVTGELVRTRVDTVCEVPIARLLVTIGGELIAIGARLVAVGARLIGVRERLIGLADGLLTVGERLRVAGGIHRAGLALLLSFERPGGIGGAIA